MIEKRTVLDRIEIAAGNFLQVRFLKQEIENGVVVAQTYHRTGLEPGIPVAKQMALVNAHLEKMGWPAVADFSALTDLATEKHTPAVVEAYRAARVAEQKAHQDLLKAR